VSGMSISIKYGRKILIFGEVLMKFDPLA
jgi:hypothetical protein